MNIEVKLLHSTPLEVAIGAVRQCYDSGDKSDSYYAYGKFVLGDKDKALLLNIVKLGHTSTLEHLVMNFQIKGISRLVLQELARHRMASLSVKSTRYTLKELKTEESFWRNGSNTFDLARVSKYINLTNIPSIDSASMHGLENLRELIASGDYSNDEVKYALPESYKVDLYWSINVRSMMNFLTLRLSAKAHFEIQELAVKINNEIPEEYIVLINP